MRFVQTLAYLAMARTGDYSGSTEMFGGIARRLHLAAVFLVLFTFPLSATSRQARPEHAGSKSSPQQPKASRERQASSEVDARVSDVMNLAASASPDSSRSLISYLNDSSPLVRAAALSGLASLQDSKSVPVIAAVLEKDKDEFVRRQAAFALGDFHDPAARPYLLKALGDKSTDVKAAAMVSLGNSQP
ncbi:MAG: HEAT repeat domain-containing protein [Blastocatellia bacterium]